MEEEKKEVKEKPKKKVSNIMLVLICIMVTLYAVAAFALSFLGTVEINDTLTTAWFAFWGVELINLTAIKTTKVKHNADGEKEESETAEEETEEEAH